MRRTMIQIILSALLILGITAITARADGAHITSGPNVYLDPPGSLTVTATAELAGLGNGQYTATLNVTGQASYNCANGGNNIPAPHSPITSTTPGTPTPFFADHNGRGTFTTSTTFAPALTMTGKDAVAAGCPNRNWTAILIAGTAQVTSAYLIIAGGQHSTTVFAQLYTF